MYPESYMDLSGEASADGSGSALASGAWSTCSFFSAALAVASVSVSFEETTASPSLRIARSNVVNRVGLICKRQTRLQFMNIYLLGTRN